MVIAGGWGSGGTEGVNGDGKNKIKIKKRKHVGSLIILHMTTLPPRSTQGLITNYIKFLSGL